MKKKGKLSNTLSVCDVSGSMSGTPMEVCIALGLLVSEISKDPMERPCYDFQRKSSTAFGHREFPS